MRAEQGLGNWREVARLVRQLEKHQALTADQAAPIRSRAVREALRGLRDDPGRPDALLARTGRPATAPSPRWRWRRRAR
jgi:uncharacterized protein HemY